MAVIVSLDPGPQPLLYLNASGEERNEGAAESGLTLRGTHWSWVDLHPGHHLASWHVPTGTFSGHTETTAKSTDQCGYLKLTMALG